MKKKNNDELRSLIKDLIEVDKLLFGDIEHTKSYCQMKLSLLLEEAGELAGEVRTYFGRKYRPEKISSKEKVAGEIGDVLNLCFVFCEVFGLDINEIICNTKNKLTKRHAKYIENNPKELN